MEQLGGHLSVGAHHSDQGLVLQSGHLARVEVGAGVRLNVYFTYLVRRTLPEAGKRLDRFLSFDLIGSFASGYHLPLDGKHSMPAWPPRRFACSRR